MYNEEIDEIFTAIKVKSIIADLLIEKKFTTYGDLVKKTSTPIIQENGKLKLVYHADLVAQELNEWKQSGLLKIDIRKGYKLDYDL